MITENKRFHVEIDSSGGHPALAAHPGSDGPRDETSDTDLHTPTGVQIMAPDLQHAQSVPRRRHDEFGHEPAMSTLLRLEVVLGDTADRARSTLRRLDAQLDRMHAAQTVRYVGTPAGLHRLIDDIRVTEVADGVVLQLLVPDQLPLVRAAVDDATFRTSPIYDNAAAS